MNTPTAIRDLGAIAANLISGKDPPEVVHAVRTVCNYAQSVGATATWFDLSEACKAAVEQIQQHPAPVSWCGTASHIIAAIGDFAMYEHLFAVPNRTPAAPETWAEIVAIEPRLRELEAIAKRLDPDDERGWVFQVKHPAQKLVGWDARDPRLADVYELVLTALRDAFEGVGR